MFSESERTAGIEGLVDKIAAELATRTLEQELDSSKLYEEYNQAVRRNYWTYEDLSDSKPVSLDRDKRDRIFEALLINTGEGLMAPGSYQEAFLRGLIDGQILLGVRRAVGDQYRFESAIGEYEFLFSSVLISKKRALTVAHGGYHNRKVDLCFAESSSQCNPRPLHPVRMHSAYDPVNKSNDIAVIELEREVEEPVCEPIDPSDVSKVAIAVGHSNGSGYRHWRAVSVLGVCSSTGCCHLESELVGAFASGNKHLGGESGGALVIKADERWRLLGLIKRPCGGNYLYENVFHHQTNGFP